MKTAISIPDDIYQSAEKLADQLGTSRSQLYTQAIDHYVERHRYDNVTAKLDEIYAQATQTQADIALMKLQLQALPKEDW